jgi:GAF domain-containing protein
VRRRGTLSRKPAKPQLRKPTRPKRSNAPTAAHQGSSSVVGLQEQLDARTRQLNEAIEREQATAEVLRVISSSPGELAPVFEAMLANAVRVCGARLGNLLSYDGAAFRVVAQHGAPQEYLKARQREPVIRPRPGASLDRLVKTKQVIHIADMVAEKGSDSGMVVELAGARTFLNVPMLKDNELIGALGIYRQEVRPFTDKQIELVQNFAAQAVIAIENTQLLKELRESLQQQTATAAVLNVISRSPRHLQPVFDSIVATAAELCKADFAMIHRWEQGKFHLVAANKVEAEYVKWLAQNPPASDNGSISGRVVAAGATIHIPDILTDSEYTRTRSESLRRGQQRTMLGVPLMREGVAIGVIALHRTEVRPFTNKQIELVNTFADQAVIAIENVHLFEAEQQRTRELTESLEQQTATADLLGVISSSPGDIQPVFAAMLENAVRICDAKFGVVYRCEGDTMRFVAMHNVPPALAQRPLPGRRTADSYVASLMVIPSSSSNSSGLCRSSRDEARPWGASCSKASWFISRTR